MGLTQPTSGADPPAPMTGVGDQRAQCAALLQKTEPIVFRLLYMLVGHRQTAEDLTQETCHHVWASWGQHDPARDSVAWVCQIARGVHVDHLRRNGAIKRGGASRQVNADPSEENGSGVETIADTLAENPTDAAIRRESEGDMHEAASTLSASDRQLYAMCVEGLSVEEMVDRTGRTRGAIETALSRMRQRLRRKLARHDL